MTFLLFFGFGAAVVAMLLAVAFASSRRRVTRLLGIGIGVGVAWLVVGYFLSPTNPSAADCSDCGEFLGRYWEPALAVFVLALNVAGWCGGVFLGTAMRAIARRG